MKPFTMERILRRSFESCKGIDRFVTHLGEEAVFTSAKVATTIKGIKSGKAAGGYEIRSKMLKALTGDGILWLT